MKKLALPAIALLTLAGCSSFQLGKVQEYKAVTSQVIHEHVQTNRVATWVVREQLAADLAVAVRRQDSGARIHSNIPFIPLSENEPDFTAGADGTPDCKDAYLVIEGTNLIEGSDKPQTYKVCMAQYAGGYKTIVFTQDIKPVADFSAAAKWISGEKEIKKTFWQDLPASMAKMDRDIVKVLNSKLREK